MATPEQNPYNTYLGNGVTTEFSIGFTYTNESSVKVYVKRSGGEEELLPNTDYSFVNKTTIKFPTQGSSEAILAVGDVMTIQRETPVENDFVFSNQKRLFPEDVMEADDNEMRILQEHARQLGRALVLNPTSRSDPAEVVEQVERVYDSIDKIDTVADNIDDVNDVADNMTKINTVSNNINNVNSVADNISNVNTVAGISSAVSNVSGIASDVSDVASIKADIQNVNSISGDIEAVADNLQNIDTVADNITDIGSVAQNISNVNAVADNETNINAVNANKTNISAVAGNATNINTVAGISSDITTVSGIKTDVQSVVGMSSAITTVNSNASNINAVAGNASNINAVAGNSSNINAVATNVSAVTNCSTNMADIKSAPGAASNAAASAEESRVWATGDDDEVAEYEQGEHSSHTYASLAMAIANTPEDVPVIDGIDAVNVIRGPKGEQGDPGSSAPNGGTTGQVLAKRSDADGDTYWKTVSGTGAVDSVNGKTGTVVLNYSDVGAASAAQGSLAASALQPNDNITQLNNNAGFITSAALNGYQLEANVETLSATDSITLADNAIYNGGEQTALTIALPATVDVSFLAEIDFTSGNTETTLSYSIPNIDWRGDDLQYDDTAQKKIFVPVANKRYTVLFDYDGTKFWGTVRGE